jgi:hypothetical protein
MLAAVGVVVAGPAGTVGTRDWLLGASAALVAVAGTALPTRTGTRWPFRAAIVVAGMAVTELLLRGSDMA